MNAVKVVTGIVTIANAHIWEPTVIDGSPPMYTATIIIPKDEPKTITGIRTAVENAVREGNLKFQGSYFGKTARKNTPILDGDAKGMSDIFKNCWVVNASTFDIPSVVDHRVFPITDHTLVCSGSKVRVSLTFYPYANGKVKGIGCMLGNIQKALLVNKVEPLPLTQFDTFSEEFLHILLKV